MCIAIFGIDAGPNPISGISVGSILTSFTHASPFAATDRDTNTISAIYDRGFWD